MMHIVCVCAVGEHWAALLEFRCDVRHDIQIRPEHRISCSRTYFLVLPTDLNAQHKDQDIEAKLCQQYYCVCLDHASPLDMRVVMQRHAPTHALTLQRVLRAANAVHRQSFLLSSCVAETGTHSAGYAENRGYTQVQFLDEVVDTPVVVYLLGDERKAKTSSAPATLYQRKRDTSFPAASAGPLDFKWHEAYTRTTAFFLHAARNSPSREWTKAQVRASQGSVFGEHTGRVIIVIASRQPTSDGMRAAGRWTRRGTETPRSCRTRAAGRRIRRAQENPHTIQVIPTDRK